MLCFIVRVSSLQEAPPWPLFVSSSPAPFSRMLWYTAHLQKTPQRPIAPRLEAPYTLTKSSAYLLKQRLFSLEEEFCSSFKVLFCPYFGLELIDYSHFHLYSPTIIEPLVFRQAPGCLYKHYIFQPPLQLWMTMWLKHGQCDVNHWRTASGLCLSREGVCCLFIYSPILTPKTWAWHSGTILGHMDKGIKHFRNDRATRWRNLGPSTTQPPLLQ